MADLQTRYAKALFELSIERGLTSDYMEQAGFISTAIADPECQRIIAHPRIPMKEKFAFLDNAFAGRVHDDLLRFMRLTVTKNREEFLAPAMDNLVEMIRRHQNFTTAKVVSAFDLTLEQITRLQTALTRKLGKQVEVETETDSSLIGGFRLHVDGHIFDRTIKHLLKDMKETIGKGNR
ncbi:MAG: ATP synthase F1 subunit delta [Defluviitaleaceae bacterium]|nr:ATP synthase F1 subunit delta [Defluviitaleaceae bacterium]